MYRFNYFTEKANHVINLAITSAEELGHNYIGSEHLLLGILKEDAGLGAQALRESGVRTACAAWSAVRKSSSRRISA